MNFKVGDKVTYSPVEYIVAPGQTGYQWAIEYASKSVVYTVIKVHEEENGIRIKGRLRKQDGTLPDEIWVNAEQFVKYDPNATYNAKVHEIAEELSRYSPLYDVDTYGVKNHMDAARAMVAKMADCYIAGYMSNCDEYTQEGIDLWTQNATAECVERGLIPNTKTDNDGIQT